MHLLTTPLLYRILTFKASLKRTRIVGLILLTLFTLVMVIHIVMDEFILHAVSFGIAVYLIATESLKIVPQQVPDLMIRRKIRNIAFFGSCMFHCLQYPHPLRCNDHKLTRSFSLLRFGLHFVVN
jgi:dihydroceramidase